MADQPKAQFVEPDERLSEKVTEGGPGAVDAATLDRAEQVVTEMADSYIDAARDSIERLTAAYEELRKSGAPTTERYSAVFQVAHEIKGQAGTFSFDLMTAIANQLCQFIEGMDDSGDEKTVEVIGLHINTLQLILAQNLKGDGGEAGQALISGLQQVVEKRS